MIHIDLQKTTLNKPAVFIQNEKGAVLEIKLTDDGALATVDDLVLVLSNEASRYRLQAEMTQNGQYRVIMDEVLKDNSGSMLAQLTFKQGESAGVTGLFTIFITPNAIKYEPIIPESAYFELAVVGHGKAGLAIVGNVLEEM